MVFNTGSVVIVGGRIRVYSGGVGVDCGYNKREEGSSDTPISERLQATLEAFKKTFQDTFRRRSSATAGDHEKEVTGHPA